jgi:hypothetical protein
MQAEFDAKEEKYREEAERLEKKRLMKVEKEKKKKLEKEKRLQNYRDEKAAARRKNHMNDGARVHREQAVSELDGKQVNTDPSETEVEGGEKEEAKGSAGAQAAVPAAAPVASRTDAGDSGMPFQLLPGWFAAVDPSSGAPYFYSPETGERTWDWREVISIPPAQKSLYTPRLSTGGMIDKGDTMQATPIERSMEMSATPPQQPLRPEGKMDDLRGPSPLQRSRSNRRAGQPRRGRRWT